MTYGCLRLWIVAAWVPVTSILSYSHAWMGWVNRRSSLWLDLCAWRQGYPADQQLRQRGIQGDIGVFSAIDLEEGLLQITFEERIVDYEFNELDEIDLAYATCIHKAQGSEYPAVVIPMAMSHFMLLERNLPYTGVTQGKQLVVVIAQPKPWLWRLKISDLNAGWLIWSPVSTKVDTF